MKKRKFADGGGIGDMPQNQQPQTSILSSTPSVGSVGGGDARGGLDQINQGANAVGSALNQVSGSLQNAQTAIGGGQNTNTGGFGQPQDIGGFQRYAQMLQQQQAKSAGMTGMKKGGKVKGYAKGGSVKSASSRGDGIAQRGKTKGRMV